MAIISSNSLVPQKVENRATLPPGNCTTRDLPQRYKYCDPKGHSTPMFMAAMSTTAKLWKEPRCPLTDDWIKTWYMYTMDYYSAIRKRKKRNLAICTNMNGTRGYYAKRSKSTRDRQLSCDLTHMWNLRNKRQGKIKRQNQKGR